MTPEFVLESCVRQRTSIRNEHIMLTWGEPKRKQFICRQVPIATILETYRVTTFWGWAPKELMVRVYESEFDICITSSNGPSPFYSSCFPRLSPCKLIVVSSQVVQFVADRETMFFFFMWSSQ